MSVILLKRYPNRKLYSSDLGRYITHVDVKTLITHAEKFIVVDLKTSKVVTTTTLLNLSAKAATEGRFADAELFTKHAELMRGGI
jgi:polyhydroxyalkanoate synthesis regulator protein